jgi:hypothetical protein
MGTHVCVGPQVAHEGGEFFEESVGAVADGCVALLGDVVEGEGVSSRDGDVWGAHESEEYTALGEGG